MQITFRDYTSKKTGLTTRGAIVHATEREYRELCNEYGGVCLGCGEVTDSGCEPDARGYRCEGCDALKVYGAEEAMMMGRLVITETATEAVTS